MKALIIAGGIPPSIELLKSELKDQCLVICADSGANCLYDYNIVPDYLIGDFDSIDAKVLSYFNDSSCIIEKHTIEKDDTDAQLALNKAKHLGADRIVLLGCTGTRFDHTFGNIGLLLQCLKSNIEAYIKDNNNVIWLIDKPVCIEGRIKEYFSVLAYGAPVPNLTIRGAKYPLNNYYLELGSSLTLSNQFSDSVVSVEFDSGILMVTKSFD